MFSAPCDFVSTAPYSYKFGPSSGTALLTMTVADYSRQALLRQCCCIEVRESSSGKNAFFPTMYLLHLHLGFRVASGFILFGRLTHLRMPYAVSVRQVSGLPPASFRSRLAADTLALGYVLGATPCTRDFHPLERAHAERTIMSVQPRLYALQSLQCPRKSAHKIQTFRSALDYQDIHREPREAGPVKTSRLISTHRRTDI